MWTWLWKSNIAIYWISILSEIHKYSNPAKSSWILHITNSAPLTVNQEDFFLRQQENLDILSRISIKSFPEVMSSQSSVCFVKTFLFYTKIHEVKLIGKLTEKEVN